MEEKNLYIQTNTYHSRFISEKVAEVSQIYLRDGYYVGTFHQKLLAMRNTADVTGGKPIAVLLQSVSGVSAINPLVAFTTSMEERERCYSFILSQTPHETRRKELTLCLKLKYKLCLRYVKPLVPAVFAVASTHQSALGPRGRLWPFLLVSNP
jgi:hypothetical protein